MRQLTQETRFPILLQELSKEQIKLKGEKMSSSKESRWSIPIRSAKIQTGSLSTIAPIAPLIIGGQETGTSGRGDTVNERGNEQINESDFPSSRKVKTAEEVIHELETELNYLRHMHHGQPKKVETEVFSQCMPPPLIALPTPIQSPDSDVQPEIWKGSSYPLAVDLKSISLKTYHVVERPEWVSLVQLASLMAAEEFTKYEPAYDVGRPSTKQVIMRSEVTIHLNLLIDSIYSRPLLIQSYREKSTIRDGEGNRVSIDHGNFFQPVSNLAVSVVITKTEPRTGYEGWVLDQKRRIGYLNRSDCVSAGEELLRSMQGRPRNKRHVSNSDSKLARFFSR